MRPKLLKKYVIRNSFKLFLIYMLSSIMILSIYDNASWYSVLMRSISIGLLSFLIFYTNARIISYYKRSEGTEGRLKNLEKRIFGTGYLCTVVLFAIYHSILAYLAYRGVELHLPKTVKESGGWKMALFIAYVSLIQYTFIYLIQNFTLSQYEKGRIELELLQLKSSNAETVNQLLQQQIKPHFLFNALNTLKSLIKKKPELAEDYLIHLSDFLRASFSNTSADPGLASLTEELAICENYMEMQKVRFGAALHYQVDPELADYGPDYRLPVFSLQPLLENAIKHNVATVEMPLSISLKKDGNYITVTNNLQFKSSIEHSTGNGLTNLKERYRVISGDEILVTKDQNSFSVRIKILKK